MILLFFSHLFFAFCIYCYDLVTYVCIGMFVLGVLYMSNSFSVKKYENMQCCMFVFMVFKKITEKKDCPYFDKILASIPNVNTGYWASSADSE